MHRSRTRRTRLLGLTMVLCGVISSLIPPGYARQQTERIIARAAAVVAADASRPEESAQPAVSPPRPVAADAATSARVSEAYGKLPLSFEANQGQSDRRVKFVSRGAGYTLFLTEREAVLSLSTPAAREGGRGALSGVSANHQARAAKTKSAVVRMRLAGSNRAPQIEGQERLSGLSNYFIGNDPAKWRSNVPTFGRVKYTGVYPGIDMLYYGNNRQLEYDFIVAPGADPKMIRLHFNGARRLKVDGAGDLVMQTGAGEVRQRKPVIYQEVNGARREVAGGYALLRGGREVGFRVGGYDRSRPLVIDPVLVYSTYLGGTSFEIAYGIAVDSAGNAYVAGDTTSANFPLANPFQPTPRSFRDAFVTKFNSSGTALVYSTYLGGGNDEYAYGIAVDSAGNAYVAGMTNSPNFPLANPFQPTLGGSCSGGLCVRDAFVTKFNASGTVLVYSTYLGGSSSEVARAIAVDMAGNSYLTGSTYSSDFPLANPFQPTFGGIPLDPDAFVTKLNTSGTALVYSTYLGGISLDDAFGIAVDSAGSAYVAGRTNSSNFPLANPFQSTFRSSCAGGRFTDAFVTKFNTSGTALVYSTYLGGGCEDHAYGIAVDSAGNAYVAGRTSSTDFPLANPFQPNPGGAFVTKFNVAGTALVYSTYLGDGASARSISVDSAGNAYVAGSVLSAGIPLVNPIQTYRGDIDAFVTKFNSSGAALIYSTYLGGSNWDEAHSIAVDSAGNAYVAGRTSSTNFPLANPFQPTYGGGSDAFMSKIGDTAPPTDPIRVVLSRDTSGQLVATVTITNLSPDPIPGAEVTLVRAGILNGSAFVDGVPVPQFFGTINPGRSVTATVTFPGTAGVPSGFTALVRVDLSYKGGTYSETVQVVTP